jgi:hypothetical protein
MISREEWETAYRELIADSRKRLGPPPTFEEVEALSRGELSEVEADRVRELLSCYPDLLRVMTVPSPANAAGVLTHAEVTLTDEEIASDLEKIRERVRSAPASLSPPVVFPRKWPSPRALAIAAGIIVVIAIGSFALRRMTSEPRALITQVLYPEGTRGGGRRGLPSGAPVRLATDADYTLQPVFESSHRYREYRLELFDLSSEPPRPVWLRENVVQQPDDTYPTRLSTGDLEPGLYRLVLSGVNGTVEPLAQYTIRLSAR